MKTTKKKTTKKQAKKSTKKPKAARKKTAVSFAKFLDDHMVAGITWKELHQLAVAEAERRHLSSQRTVAALQAHARSRSYLDQWAVKMDEKGVKMTRRQKKGGGRQ